MEMVPDPRLLVRMAQSPGAFLALGPAVLREVLASQELQEVVRRPGWEINADRTAPP